MPVRKETVMGRDVIIACDFNSKEEVINFLSKFEDEKPFVKIGNPWQSYRIWMWICAMSMQQERRP